MAFFDDSNHANVLALVDDAYIALDAVKQSDTTDEYMAAMSRLMNNVSALSELGTAIIENRSVRFN